MNVLTTTGLTKRYGRLTAVDHLDLQIPRGSVFGLLGPNGSGKTTTLGMLLGAIRPHEGSFVWFNGQSDHKARKQIGAILEHPVFYPHLSGYQNLKISATIKGKGKDNIQETLDFVGLGDRGNDLFKQYSLGMKQRLAIASALIADPEVLILDEPTNGLDPQGIHDIRGLILQIAESGKTIILASHLLDEVQRVCSDYAVLQKGKCIHKGNVKHDLQGNSGWMVSADDMNKLEAVVQTLPGVVSLEKTEDGLLLTTNEDVTGTFLNQSLMNEGVILKELTERRNTLEEKFLELLKSNK